MLKKLWIIRKLWMGYFGVILFLHVSGFLLLLSYSKTNPALWGMGLLAYSFGLRHAFDADHIAAIDNSVRKMIYAKGSPYGVGFYFSLGHSSVVFLLVMLVTLSVRWIHHLPRVQEIGETIGLISSGSFLLFIGLANLVVLFNLLKVLMKMRKFNYDDNEIETLQKKRGLLTHLITPFFRFISKSWHVYPLGFLFGLGFDTATEVGLLAISATTVQSSDSMISILSLPLLFAAGMSLMDTADGIFMTSAYNWALSTPFRKIYYNLSVTSISVAAAFIIGGIELLQIFVKNSSWTNSFSTWVRNIEFGNMGYFLVALFIFAWILSIIIWKLWGSKNTLHIKDSDSSNGNY
ncbi:high-affinity nickel-transport protein [Fontibacillus solani]|uniref:Nickel/cobalt efflux system n=2 Tax=Fontibacillus solani TaxID=1572857 RepID=A0A7W3SVS3_9BACL|nr:HoxN/HupN/NixA family nickel/cobalt transporter [Fontibacillus solani]MBA9086858.1 high-affinity nickel-transport protein [Fontibacillus solani]